MGFNGKPKPSQGGPTIWQILFHASLTLSPIFLKKWRYGVVSIGGECLKVLKITFWVSVPFGFTQLVLGSNFRELLGSVSPPDFPTGEVTWLSSTLNLLCTTSKSMDRTYCLRPVPSPERVHRTSLLLFVGVGQSFWIAGLMDLTRMNTRIWATQPFQMGLGLNFVGPL